jgi:hypothetical protein
LKTVDEAVGPDLMLEGTNRIHTAQFIDNEKVAAFPKQLYSFAAWILEIFRKHHVNVILTLGEKRKRNCQL